MSDLDDTTSYPNRLVRLPEVLDMVAISRAQLYRLISSRQFPAPRKLGRSSLWPLDEVHEWVRDISKSVDPDAPERSFKRRLP